MFRTALFWLHLAAGLIAGLVIALLCATGAVLAFEKELIAWAERDARRISAPPAGAARLTLGEMQAAFRAAQPATRPIPIVVQNDPHAAVGFVTSATAAHYVDPHTGAVRAPASFAMSRFMHTTVELHRFIGLSGSESRPRGKWVTGVANLAFFILAVTGLWLWMPRTWSWRAVRPAIWFRQNNTSKARDFNWHNTIGFWCAPVLIVLTLTAMPISFRWAGELIYTITGTPLPATGPQSGGSPPPPVASVLAPASGAPHVAPDALLAHAQRLIPTWQTITLRLPASGAVQPATLIVRDRAARPRTALITLQYDPFTGGLLRRDGYEQLNAARQVRAWNRFLHTGEVFGWWAQALAGLACVGGCFLVCTGFALSWRRFFGRAKSED
ncbi:MAG: PepSY domain-containing protein [Opitutaceae bacterium]|nr:PepSY domain-containing protein [Opitutaceae bacterium]